MELSKEKRNEVYRIALSKISNNEKVNGYDGLCIILKTLAEISFMSHSYPETDVMFPEFGNFINRYKPKEFLDLLSDDGRPTKEWRVRVLEECIKLSE